MKRPLRAVGVRVHAVLKERVEALDTKLWTWREESFLAHGVAGGPYDHDQPISQPIPKMRIARRCAFSLIAQNQGIYHPMNVPFLCLMGMTKTNCKKPVRSGKHKKVLAMM